MELESALENAVEKLKDEEVDDFEVFAISENKTLIEAKRQMVDSFRRSTGRGIAIRVVRDGKMGRSSTTDISAKEVGKSISQAIAALDVMSPSEESFIAEPQEPEGDFVEQVGRSFTEISDEEKMQIALKLESAAISFDSKIARVRNPRYHESVTQIQIINSKGVSVSFRRGLVACMLIAIASDGKNSETAYEFDFSPRFEDVDPDLVAKRASEKALAKLGAETISKERLPVIFDNHAASSILGILAPSFFADNVQRSKSRISGKLSEKIYSEKITIIDDGLLSSGYASFPFDGEGIPSQRTIMVDSGKVNSWLYDSPRAFKDGVPSTGNCSRESVNSMPAIGVTNCFLKAGNCSTAKLKSGIKRGMMITDLLGVHTANPISGDFSLGVEGFLIEEGNLSRPVRGITVAGNIHDLFGMVSEVANDLRHFGSFGSPSFLVESLMLGA